jgi:hypothetical protein
MATFASVLANEPAAAGIELARTLAAGREVLQGGSDRPWYAQATWSSQTTVSLLWTEQYQQLRPLVDTSIPRPA